MKNLLRAGAVALAFALSCLAGPAFAQTANCASYDAAGTCLSGVVLWDPIAKAPYKAAGGSGGGGAATIADGADTAEGFKADPKSTATDTTPASVVALLKGQIDRLQAIVGAIGTPFQAGGSIGNTSFGISGTLPAFTTPPTVNINAGQTIGVTGNVATTIGDGADVAKGAKADTSNCSTDTTPVTQIAALKCSNSQLVLAITRLTSILAKQPALGTAGTPSADVVTVQGAPGDSPLQVMGNTIIAGCAASPCFTTTSATTAWASGQVIGDSATAGSVTKLQFQVCRVAAGTGMIRRARIKIASDTGFAGQPVILYLYRDSPTLTNGDRGTWLTTDSNYIGKIPVTLNNHFSDYEKGIGLPTDSSSNVTEINYDCASSSQVIYGLLVAGGAITPQAGSKAVTVVLEALTN